MRHSKIIKDHPIYGNFELAWGWDRPLSEYFLQAFKKDEDEEETIFSISSYSTIVPHPKHQSKLRWSNGEFLDLIEQEKLPIPEDHKKYIALDLPF